MKSEISEIGGFGVLGFWGFGDLANGVVLGGLF